MDRRAGDRHARTSSTPINPQPLFGSTGVPGSTPGWTSATRSPRSKGTIALNYLMAHDAFPLIDRNNNGLITAQEIQTFVDASATFGLPGAGGDGPTARRHGHRAA